MKKFTVFVLDDDEMFCSLLQALATRKFFIHGIEGYELNLVVFSDMKNLEGALEYIKINKPDMVLLDYFLGPDGCLCSLDILEKLISCCMKYIDIKIITGMYLEDMRLMLAKKTIDIMGIGLIQKPFSVGELLTIIKTSIEKAENA